MAASAGTPREEFVRSSWAADKRPSEAADKRPSEAAGKRQAARDLRHARDALQSASGLSAPVASELVRSHAATLLKGWPTHLLLMLAVAATAALLTPPVTLLPGTLTIAGATVAQGVLSRAFLKQDPAPASLSTWRSLFALGELAHGFGWALLAWPLMAQDLAGAQAAMAHGFVLFTVVLVAMSIAILRATVIEAVHAGLASTALIALLSAFQATGIVDRASALLAVCAVLFAAWLGHRLHRTAAITIRTRAELQASFADLEQIRANSNEARRRAEEADRAKAQFLATMSHELRTPLNAILGFSEVMKNEVLGSHSTPSYRDYSNDIHGSGQHLLKLINEILELSRIEAGQYALAEETIRLSDVIESSLALLKPRIDAKRHRITISVDPGLEDLVADANAVKQILANLISNAVKFTSPGGQITVKAGWTSRGGQYVSVRDNGPGIPPEEIPVVLSSFGRGSQAISAAEQGAGLGLSIVKGFAELHGGRFILNSTPREGTEAIVVFPARRSEGAGMHGDEDETGPSDAVAA